jgi:hypothetical protein
VIVCAAAWHRRNSLGPPERRGRHYSRSPFPAAPPLPWRARQYEFYPPRRSPAERLAIDGTCYHQGRDWGGLRPPAGSGNVLARPRCRSTQAQRTIRSTTFAAAIKGSKSSKGSIRYHAEHRPAAKGPIPGYLSGWTGETGVADWKVQSCFKSLPERPPMTLAWGKRKYFSGGVCALAATLIEKAGKGKTGTCSLTWVKMETITDIYGAGGQKKSPPQGTGIVIHRNFRFWTLSNSGRVSLRASLACVSSLDLALLRQGLLSIPSFISCTGS